MIIICSITLFVIALAFEFLGPVVLQKFFPQALVAPAPEVKERPKRAAARDSFVDDALEDLNSPSNPLANPATMAAAGIAPVSLASSGSDNNASADEAMLLTGVDPRFDFDDFRNAARDTSAVKHADQAAAATQGQQVEVIQGIPDMFADEEATQHA